MPELRSVSVAGAAGLAGREPLGGCTVWGVAAGCRCGARRCVKGYSDAGIRDVVRARIRVASRAMPGRQRIALDVAALGERPVRTVSEGEVLAAAAAGLVVDCADGPARRTVAGGLVRRCCRELRG